MYSANLKVRHIVRLTAGLSVMMGYACAAEPVTVDESGSLEWTSASTKQRGGEVEFKTTWYNTACLGDFPDRNAFFCGPRGVQLQGSGCEDEVVNGRRRCRQDGYVQLDWGSGAPVAQRCRGRNVLRISGRPIGSGGVEVIPNLSAATDRSVIPGGTCFSVRYPSQGTTYYFRADDTGAAIRGRHVDLYVGDCGRATFPDRGLIQFVDSSFCREDRAEQAFEPGPDRSTTPDASWETRDANTYWQRPPAQNADVCEHVRGDCVPTFSPGYGYHPVVADTTRAESSPDELCGRSSNLAPGSYRAVCAMHAPNCGVIYYCAMTETGKRISTAYRCPPGWVCDPKYNDYEEAGCVPPSEASSIRPAITCR